MDDKERKDVLNKDARYEPSKVTDYETFAAKYDYLQPRKKNATIDIQTELPKKIDTRSAYKKALLPVAIVALVFILATAGLAFFSGMTGRNQRNWLENENKRIAEENQKMETEYAQQQANLKTEIEEMVSVDRPSPAAEGWDIVNLTGFPLEFSEPTTIAKSDLYADGLMVVNALNPLPEDYESFVEPQLMSIGKESGGKIQVKDYNVRVLPDAYAALQAMLADAAQAGHGDYIIREGWRSTADQTLLFENMRTKLSEKYSGDILYEKTKEKVNVPGTSEFQSGLAVEIGLYNKDNPDIAKQALNESESGKWLLDNCWKYGYVFRFPIEDYPYPETLDKSNLTGVSIRLRVFRYVGVAAATVMHLKSFVLEEFVNYMIETPHIAVYEDGVIKYELYRQHLGRELGQSEDVDKPLSVSEFSSSYDNLEGIITAFYH